MLLYKQTCLPNNVYYNFAMHNCRNTDNQEKKINYLKIKLSVCASTMEVQLEKL